MKAFSIIAFTFCAITSAVPQQRPGDREVRGSVACSEVCGGLFICSRLDPKAAICAATVQDFNARYQKCQCGEPSQTFDAWPLKPKLQLQPQFQYCSRTVCPDLEAKACASETVESQGCKEAKARQAADRAACACSSNTANRRSAPVLPSAWHIPTAPKIVSLKDDRAPVFARKPDATILPYQETGILHVQPITTMTTKRAEATIMPYGPINPPRDSGMAHILPVTTQSKKAEASIMPYGPINPPRDSGMAHILPVTTQSKKAEATIMPYTQPDATILPYEED